MVEVVRAVLATDIRGSTAFTFRAMESGDTRWKTGGRNRVGKLGLFAAKRCTGDRRDSHARSRSAVAKSGDDLARSTDACGTEDAARPSDVWNSHSAERNASEIRRAATGNAAERL